MEFNNEIYENKINTRDLILLGSMMMELCKKIEEIKGIIKIINKELCKLNLVNYNNYINSSNKTLSINEYIVDMSELTADIAKKMFILGNIKGITLVLNYINETESTHKIGMKDNKIIFLNKEDYNKENEIDDKNVLKHLDRAIENKRNVLNSLLELCVTESNLLLAYQNRLAQAIKGKQKTILQINKMEG